MVDKIAKKKIRDLIVLMGSSVICGLLLAVLVVYWYGTSGQYQIKNALLDPSLAAHLDYLGFNPKTGGNSRFVYDGIEFSFFDEKAKTTRTMHLDPETYGKIYEKIRNDSSAMDTSDTLQEQFIKNPKAVLNIKVHTDNHNALQNDSKIFQAVEFTPNDYRIRLHEEKNPEVWIYYHHPGIYQEVMKAVIP